MKFEFHRIKLTDLDEKVIEGTNFYKTIAKIIWASARNLDLVEVALLINKGKSVELDSSEIGEIQGLIRDPKAGVFSYAQKAFIDYVDKVKEEYKNRNKSKS